MKKVNLLSKVLACGLVTVLLTSCGGTDTNKSSSQAVSNASTTTETVQSGSDYSTSNESALTALSTSDENNESVSSVASSTPGENNSSEASSANNATEPPVDGDRVVLAGTVQTLSYADLLALQREKEPNIFDDKIYETMDDGHIHTILIFDEPQVIQGKKTPFDTEYYTDTVYLIDISGAEGCENYVGKHVWLSITPDKTWYPTDVSAPFGQPHTGDVNFLQE